MRIKIFEEVGIPALNKHGFTQSPFSGACFGKYDRNLYCYDFCRIGTNANLEMITTYINRRDKWVKVFLNIFKPLPDLQSLDLLKNLDGIQFHLPPNSITEMRLRSDDRKYVPLFYLFSQEHKIGTYFTKWGYNRSIKALTNLIGKDMDNIDYYVKRWHEIHRYPLETNWDGFPCLE